MTHRGAAFEVVVRPLGRDAAICLIGGAQARALEEEGGRADVTFAVSALAEIFGNELLACLANARATRWGKDPFARGAWSVAQPGHADKRLVLAQLHHDRVLFTGEATISCGRRGSAAPMSPACAPPARRWRFVARRKGQVLVRCRG